MKSRGICLGGIPPLAFLATLPALSQATKQAMAHAAAIATGLGSGLGPVLSAQQGSALYAGGDAERRRRGRDDDPGADGHGERVGDGHGRRATSVTRSRLGRTRAVYHELRRRLDQNIYPAWL